MTAMFVIVAILTLCNLALWWRQHRRAQANHADVWQAIAELRMHHNALAHATADEFRAMGSRMEEFELDQVTMIRPPNCNCVNCRKRHQLEAN